MHVLILTQCVNFFVFIGGIPSTLSICGDTFILKGDQRRSQRLSGGSVDLFKSPQDQKILSFFSKYKENGDDAMLSRGIEALCKDLVSKYCIFLLHAMYNLIKFCTRVG